MAKVATDFTSNQIVSFYGPYLIISQESLGALLFVIFLDPKLYHESGKLLIILPRHPQI
jgi:hypothetical protein